MRKYANVCIDKLKPYERNARTHSAEQIEKIANSIKEFGFINPVLIDGDFGIIAGHGRVEGAKKLGMTEVPCLFVEDLTEEQKRAYIIADNKLAEDAGWDTDLLKLELGELADLDFDISLTGFSLSDFDLLGQHDGEDEYEQKMQEFRERMEAGELSEDSEEYQEFLQKFEAKKTTDDCYTPPNVYEAVADYVAEHYGVNKKDFMRPFVPNGDYQKEKYTAQSIVVDNPPFSIISEICMWYQERGIKFFMFAPSLTVMGIRAAQKVVTGVKVTYENGANVSTAFVTNMDEYEIRSAPDLYKAIEKANNENLANMKKQLPVYDYPLEVVRHTTLQQFSKYGVVFAVRAESCYRVSELDEQKAVKKGIFGSGYLISEKAAAEKAAAEKWHLSEREKEIIKALK